VGRAVTFDYAQAGTQAFVDPRKLRQTRRIDAGFFTVP